MLDKVRGYAVVFCCGTQLWELWLQVSRACRDIIAILEARRDLVQDAEF